MIKCDGFGKLLKLSFSILLIGFFGGLVGSSVNALGVYTTVGINSFNSPVNSNYSITALKGGGFLSNYLGVGKSVLALDNQRLFRWTTNGYPYVYLRGQNFNGTDEGFFDRYYSCDLMTGAGMPNNCSSSIIDYSGGTAEFDKAVFKSFFQKVVQGDNFYTQSEDYRYVGATWSYALNYIRVCWNSEELGKSFCFMGGRCTGGPTYCQNLGSLVNSQHLKDQFSDGLTFGLLANSWIGKAPGQLGYNDSYEGGSQGSIDIGQGTINITGDFVFNTCTNGDIISSLESEGYNKYMCYGGIDIWTNFQTGVNYNPVPLSGLSLHYILSHDTEFSSYDSWFTYFYNLQQRTIGGNDVYLNKWTNYPAVYKTYFDLFFEYGGNGFLGNINDLNQYCGMVDSVNYDEVYNGNYFRNKCASIISSNYNGGNYAGSGQYSAGVNWGSNVKPQTNAVEFIQDFFNKLNEVLPTNYSDMGFGILPVYIISFMIALIFFRFLMK